MSSVTRGYLQTDNCVDDSQATIKRELRDLRSWKFTVRVSELDHGLVVHAGVSVRAHTIESSLFDRIIDGRGIIEVDCFGNDGKFGGLGDIRGKNERTDFVFRAEVRLHTGLITDGFPFLKPQT